MTTEQDLIDQLTATGDYKVIRRLKPVDRYHDDSGAEKHIGIYLDTEATGLNPGTDKIIELALVPFEYDSEGRIYRILPAYNALQDPGVPISAFITRITGITDEMVAGQAIDLDEVTRFLANASLVIAHNASFDRPFVELLHPGFATINWACSIADVNWNEEGFEGVKLEYLGYKYGFFYEGHRATVDCQAGIELLSQRLPGGERVMKRLLDNAGRTDVRIWAERAPFSKKDLLKQRGYRWSPGGEGLRKAWYKDLPESQLDTEML
ncbi:MAG: 3'-5' exonuclease, partial [Gammaproteobacteria bacterium]|nr:3'-5' exonuclease [Gammaproteobacteria bacterium]